MEVNVAKFPISYDGFESLTEKLNFLMDRIEELVTLLVVV